MSKIIYTTSVKETVKMCTFKSLLLIILASYSLANEQFCTTPTLRNHACVNGELSNYEKFEVKPIGPLVMTTNGLVRGLNEIFRYKDKDYTYLQFSGIPYGVVKKRFQAPQPSPSWTGIRDATKEGPPCLQIDATTNITLGSEDCLFLNIMTPNLHQDKKAVIVVIHGGVFRISSGNKEALGTERYSTHDVIVVTLNHRLGAFGFLYTGTKDAPGNAGLKDVIEALRWIKRNIACFGGDPDNVTVQGLSSGAIIVDLLTLSPVAKGLFHKAIANSGNAIFLFDDSSNNPFDAFEIGRYMGIATNDVNELTSALQATDSEKLLRAAFRQTQGEASVILKMKGPTIERTIPGVEQVINKYPRDILRSGSFNDVPYMITLTGREGIFMFRMPFYLNAYESTPASDEYFDALSNNLSLLDYIIPENFWPTAMTSNKRFAALKKLQRFYFRNNSDNRAQREAYADFIGDIWNFSTIELVKLRRAQSKQPIFVSMFTHDPSPEFKSKTTYAMDGAGHGDDVPFMFSLPTAPLLEKLSGTDAMITDAMPLLISNFAKYSDPTPETSNVFPVKWNPTRSDHFDYFSINATFEMLSDPFPKRIVLWNSLFTR